MESSSQALWHHPSIASHDQLRSNDNEWIRIQIAIHDQLLSNDNGWIRMHRCSITYPYLAVSLHCIHHHKKYRLIISNSGSGWTMPLNPRNDLASQLHQRKAPAGPCVPQSQDVLKDRGTRWLWCCAKQAIHRTLNGVIQHDGPMPWGATARCGMRQGEQ